MVAYIGPEKKECKTENEKDVYMEMVPRGAQKLHYP